MGRKNRNQRKDKNKSNYFQEDDDKGFGWNAKEHKKGGLLRPLI